MILVSYVLFKIHTKKLITRKHKAIGTWHWAVETIAGDNDGSDCYLALLGRNDRRRERRGRLLPGTVGLQNITVCDGSDGVVANGDRDDCCGRSQQGPDDNGQSGNVKIWASGNLPTLFPCDG